MINTRFKKSYKKRKRIGISLSIFSGLLLATNLVMVTADAASRRNSQRRSMWSNYSNRVEDNKQSNESQKETVQSSSTNTPSLPIAQVPATITPATTTPTLAPAQNKVRKGVTAATVSIQPTTPVEPSQIERVATLAATNPTELATTSYSYKNFAPATTRILEGFASTAIAGGVIALIIQNLVIPSPATYRSSFVTVRG